MQYDVYDPKLIITSDNRNSVIAFLAGRGAEPPALALMSNVQLANAYHECGGAPTEIQRATSQAIATLLAAMPRGGAFDEELVRYLARAECEKIIATIPPRRLEIITPLGINTLDGIIHYQTEQVIKIASLGHAVMMVGPAGCGKTTIAEHTAIALGLLFYITSTVNDTHELLGFVDGYGKYHATSFRRAFEFGGLWTADEIDAWDAPALLAANSALANGLCQFPDGEIPVRRHANFRMIATANTFGTGADRVYIGRNELDAASLDRFATIAIDYDINLERMFAGDKTRWLEHIWETRKKVTANKIRHVISSRAIAMGAAALSNGIDWDDVCEIYLYKGMNQRDRDRL